MNPTSQLFQLSDDLTAAIAADTGDDLATQLGLTRADQGDTSVPLIGVHIGTEAITPPCVVIAPNQPWQTGGDTFDSWTGRYLVQLVCESGENLRTLEDLGAFIDTIATHLPVSWLIVDIGAPFPVTYNDRNFAAVTLTVTT